jgi:hypothetical protein
MEAITMHARHLAGIVTAIALFSPAAAVVRTESGQHLRHENHSVKGPLPEAVREATRRFRDVNAAIADGYVQNGGCVSGPDEGAMGVHYVKFSLFDDVIDVEHPEALVYEPRDGRLHLVAAEYITPAAAWEATHDDFDLPHVMGQLFHFAAGPNRYGPPAFYELHVWAWNDNPKGTFADWNPKVSCSDWPTDR